MPIANPLAQVSNERAMSTSGNVEGLRPAQPRLTEVDMTLVEG